jgi:hypothetical protein
VLNSRITTPKIIHCTAFMLALCMVGFYTYDMCVASNGVENLQFLTKFHKNGSLVKPVLRRQIQVRSQYLKNECKIQLQSCQSCRHMKRHTKNQDLRPRPHALFFHPFSHNFCTSATNRTAGLGTHRRMLLKFNIYKRRARTHSSTDLVNGLSYK